MIALPPLPEMPQSLDVVFSGLANTAIVIGVVGCLLFVIFYQRLTHWRSTPLGRNVMAFMACLLLLVVIALVRAFVPYLDSWVDPIRFAGYAVTAFVVWHRVYLLIRYQTREEYGDGRDDVPHSGHPHEHTPPEGVPTRRE